MSLNTERNFRKYLKYKAKYLQLKSLQLGGDKGEILQKFLDDLNSATDVTLKGPFDLKTELLEKISGALAANKTLTTLTISHLPQGSAYQRLIGKELAKGFPDSLTTLNLIETNFVNSNKPAFHDSAIEPILNKLVKIKSLNISGSSLTDSPVNTIIGDYIEKNKSVITLKLSNCSLGCNNDADINAIAKGLGKNSTIESLDLSKNCIKKGADNIGSAIKKNKTLKNLDLSSNGIDNSGVIELAKGLAENKTLITLNLDANVFDFAGAKALIDAIKKNNTLETLSIKGMNLEESKLLTELNDTNKSKILIFK